ncbi:HalOD1 output domain-containing protein [Natrarchaeobius oligotrophus]|uniref:Halobacterial output domain-containing protein n=1 Tax=Natrarchaeobius chitinivorans TaxID=1679083 RepID=A0A3N6PFE6_NATCH|nr:HalOD1 output domain-containing protein [Natrarchaeobius chitinivorans]RQG98759.1 hypothetical protein EA472_16175 [Natrarchaeobius chitinivorans]
MTNLLTRHDRGPIHRVHFDPTAVDGLASTIISALSTVEDEPATELPPLYETIDVEAVGRLLEHAVAAGSNRELVLEFTVDDWDVTIVGDGRVLVYDREERGDERVQ